MRAFRIAYDGTGYRGFQRQPHGDTVEDALFSALDALGIEREGGAPAGYSAAGRTDAGVSARAQTVALEASEWLRPRALNSELPAAIRAWAHADAGASFHATHDAVERRYQYFLCEEAAARGAIDLQRAKAAAGRLSGGADFHNFTPDSGDTERTVEVSVRREAPFLVVECVAGGFSRELVRRLVTALAAVGRGERALSFLDRALSPAPLEGPDGIGPAAPEPLALTGVSYPGLEFTVDERALESTRQVFRRRRRERLAGARVAEALCPDDR